MNRHRAASQGPGTRPHLPALVRAAAIAVSCLVLAWMTFHFARYLRPQGVQRAADAPETPPEYQILDFSQEWASARNLFNGKPIYRDHNQAIHDYLGFWRNLSDPATYYSLQVNAHPPTSVLLAIPFAWMDYPNAFLAWNLVSLALLAACVWLVVRQLGLRVTLGGLLTGYALLLLCNPFRVQMIQGQLNIVLLALISGAWASERSDQPGLSGILLGLATALKLFPGFLLVYYAARGRWRVVLSGVVTLVVCTALTLLVVGLEAYSAYFGQVIPHVARSYHDTWVNASLSGLFHKLFASRNPFVVPLVHSPALYLGATILGDGLLGLVLLAAIRRARTREEHDLTFGLAVITMLLVSPLTWDHYYLLALVPLALLWVRLRQLGHWRWLYLACVAALWLPPKLVYSLCGLPPDDTLRQPATPLQVLGVLSFQCYALVGLFVVLTAALARELRGQQEPQQRAAVADSLVEPPCAPFPLSTRAQPDVASLP